MKPMPATETTLSLSEFKRQASELLTGLGHSQRPIVITQDGGALAVVVPPDDYAFLRQQRDVLRAIESGLNDVEHGRVLTDEALERRLNEA